MEQFQNQASHNDLKTVLIVDNDAAVLELIGRVLANGNYKILRANNGLDALRQSKDNGKIDLLLSEFQMPGMSGMELATKMTSGRPTLQVLLMSSFPE